MPLYEYRCQSCENELEALQKFSDDDLKKCPECGIDALVRKTSMPSFQLKGGGWFKDGYSNPSDETSNAKAPASVTPTKAPATPSPSAS